MITWLAASDALKSRIERTVSEHENQLHRYEVELLKFNSRHNLVSSAAEDHVYQHHIKHCLALNCFEFPDGAKIVDWGSGGGLPAIPLAITNAGIVVTAVDKVGKKMQTVSAIARRLSLQNVRVFHGLAEAWPERATYSVSRATAPLSTLWRWHKKMLQNGADTNTETGNANNSDGADISDSVWPPGLICLKGGKLDSEVDQLIESFPDVTVSGYSVGELLRTEQGGSYFDGKSLLLVQQR